MIDSLKHFIDNLPIAYLALSTFIWTLVKDLGRAWHAWSNAGGWVGVKNALLFGTTVPKGQAMLTVAKEPAAPTTAEVEPNSVTTTPNGPAMLVVVPPRPGEAPILPRVPRP